MRLRGHVQSVLGWRTPLTSDLHATTPSAPCMSHHLSKQPYTRTLSVTELHHRNDLIGEIHWNKKKCIRGRFKEKMKLWARSEHAVM